MEHVKELKAALRENPLPICQRLFPAGKLDGQRFCVGSINGEPGKSLKICVAGKRNGDWRDYAGDAGDQGSNLLELIMRKQSVSFAEACRIAREWLGMPPIGPAKAKLTLNGANSNGAGKFHKFNWSDRVAATTDSHLSKLSGWRGLTPDFCWWLRDNNLVGLHQGCFAFPVQEDDGRIIGCHYRREDGSWRYDPLALGMRPFTFGDPSADALVLIFESQWDAFAVADKLGIHQPEDGAPKLFFIVTRGAGNGALARGKIPDGYSDVFAFPQNDEEKNGHRAGELWLVQVVASCKATIRRVHTPGEHKDPNDWTRAGANFDEILAAMNAAEPVTKKVNVSSPADFAFSGDGTASTNAQPPDEFAELVELARAAFAAIKNSANSTNSAGDSEQPAVFPADSILAPWMKFARAQEESADAFLIGVILAVCGAILARRVYFRWGAHPLFPNVFIMLTGKPGDRKSSCINLAEILARLVLPANAFLPASFSPEAMFNEYYEDAGGRPDKVWVVDDANATLKDWQKSVNGERVATRFLELYDCKALSESFQRNRKESEDGKALREVAQTSTSVLFGATFNIAAFQGQDVRGGMSRRFLYYVAERHGRLIVRPSAKDDAKLVSLTKAFKKLLALTGEIDFSPEATGIWKEYQEMNRTEMDTIEPWREAELGRLSSAPMQTLSIAMIFEACRWAKAGGQWTGLIQPDTLRMAIDHVNACLAAAKRLDAIGHQAEIGQEAEIFLAKVRHDFRSYEGFHFATRSELTKYYCPNSGRAGSWKPDDLYLRFIPMLERRGEALMLKKEGKRETFAFRAEGGVN